MAGTVVETPNSGEDTKKQPEKEKVMLWSQTLATPTDGECFSPARSMEDKDSLHGTGLQKAMDHGKMIARSGRRTALMLLEAAHCYEQFGNAVMKASQANPIDGAASKSITSLCHQTKKLAATLRDEIAAPLQGHHNNFGETLPAIHQKYIQSRQNACGARQRAMLARTKYLKAINDAEEACNLVLKTVAEKDDSTEEKKTNPPENTKADWEKSLEAYGKIKGAAAVDHVTHLLHDVRVLQNRYESLVEVENAAVNVSHRMEAIALEAVQKMEEQRLCAFYDGMVRMYDSIKNSLDDLVISAEIDLDESSSGAVKVVQKKGDFFSTILKAGVAQAEKTGIADAEALGLDEDVGKLREEMQTRIASRLTRLKKVKALSALFDGISVAAKKLANGLQLIVNHEDSYVSSKGVPVEHLRTLMSGCEGPRTLELWNNLMKTVEKESEAFLQFSRVLGNTKESKLDKVVATDEKEVKDLKEQDDTRWKHLCDAARVEMRTETKYRQITAQTAKARERMGSVDKNAETGGAQASRSPQKPQNRTQKRAMEGMNKAFGNFLSILPDGGEQAMQILSPDARRAVAEKQVAEADEKELKGRQAYDNATAYKNQIVEAYRTSTEPLAKKYEAEEMSGMEDIKASLESLLACLKALQISRHEALGPSTELRERPLVVILDDLKEWAAKVSSDIELQHSKVSRDEETGMGFKLKVTNSVSEKSNEVLQFARIGQSDSFESDGFDDGEKDEASQTSDPAIRVSTGQDSNRSLDLNLVKEEEESGNDKTADSGQQTAKWLHKSFSAPIGKKPHGFKKFRKFHSGVSDNDKDRVENAEDTGDDMTDTSLVSNTIPPQNNQENSETQVFALFWPDYEGTPPGVTHSFGCTFLPKDSTKKSIGSVEHGRLFLTHRAVVFIAWRGRKAIFNFSMMTKVEKHPNLFEVADDTLLVSAVNKGTPTSLLLSCFNHRDQALEALLSRLEKEKEAQAERAKKEIASDNYSDGEEPASEVAPVAPDAIIGKMEIVLSKKIRGVPVHKFHDMVWLDKTSDGTFYGGWLDKGGKCKDLKISDWESSDAGFVGPWCGETYSHRRELRFQLQRNSMIGPPVAGVKQTQFVRLDGTGRSVMMMRVEMDGIPYADTFSVEVRWVASRVGAKDVNIQVGVFVHFHKSTMLKSQIRNGTLSETKPVHESLFNYVKAAVADVSDQAADDDDVEVEADNTAGKATSEDPFSMVQEMIMDNLHVVAPVFGIFLLLFIRWAFSSSRGHEIAQLNAKVEDLQTEMKLMRQSIEELTKLLKEQNVHKH